MSCHIIVYHFVYTKKLMNVIIIIISMSRTLMRCCHPVISWGIIGDLIIVYAPGGSLLLLQVVKSPPIASGVVGGATH